ncbi:MAG: PEP/pyruvate-binding domain-containing protein [Candidatus Thermoplasmatota archaeon]
MIEENKEEKILSKIEEITGIKPHKEEERYTDKTEKLRKYEIDSVLIVSSSYDYFLLEEEGRLSNLFSELYSPSGKNPPSVSHVETEESALKKLSDKTFDLTIIFNKPEDIGVLDLAKKIRDHSKSKIVILNNDIEKIRKISEADEDNLITEFFTWNGDGKVVLGIVQLIEDSVNLEKIKKGEKCRCILLIEDSIQHYSNYITLIYDEIREFLDEIIDKNLTDKQKDIRFDRRPFVFHAKDLDTSIHFFEKFKDDLVCIITDNHLGDAENRVENAGVEFTKKIIDEGYDIPIAIQSSEPIHDCDFPSKKIQFLSKNSANLIGKLKRFIEKSIEPKKIRYKPNDGEVKVMDDISDLQDFLLFEDSYLVVNLAKKNVFSNWFNSLGEFELSEKFRFFENGFEKPDKLQKNLLDVIENYRYSLNQVAIKKFERREDEEKTKIRCIGDGALGGKARGLAFLSKIFSKYVSEDMLPGLRVTIPRSIVLSTDVFDSFLERNDLLEEPLFELSDERIASKFMKSDLPAIVLGDLRSFVRNTRKPLIIRSSGVLEDSLLQPFAGVYASMLLPNESWETDLRFQEACNAIKYVYASTYFERARNYVRSTPKSITDEKMGVLIQEVVGKKYGTYFYPDVSGVAKSYNYYPSGDCKPEDGIVYLALGLGKSIVEGGSSFCFCPEKPKKPLAGTPKDFMRYSQRDFYALNLRSVYRIVNKNEESSLDKLDLDVAKKHGVLDKLVSTYDPRDDRLYPGYSNEGHPVLDFSPIVKYNEIPLSKAMKLLLNVCEIILGYPVEIEFAVNLFKEKDKPAELTILQIRNMRPPGESPTLSNKDLKSNDVLCYSKHALGNGVIKNIKDIVFVKSEKYDMSNSMQVVDQVKKINRKLMDEDKPYILAGPGRWGSADQWLGIPVAWGDIAGAKVIIETPFERRSIDFSQGSHFFHDMLSSNVAYLKTEKGEGNLDWNLLNSFQTVDEIGEIKHVKTPYPLEVVVDGKNGKAVIKKDKEK